MIKKSRFSRTTMIDDLKNRAKHIQDEKKFHHNSGWAQLRLQRSDNTYDDLIERAVAYGRWKALLEIAEGADTGMVGREYLPE